jgi:tetratricopeptide (TPR) repeat protein
MKVLNKNFLIKKIDSGRKEGLQGYSWGVLIIFLYFFWLPFLLGSGLVSSAFQGSVQGAIKGKVVDQDGQPIADVQITITSMRYSAVRFTLRTDKQGKFFQIGLQPDYYQVKAEKESYQPVIIEKRVGIQQSVEVVFQLDKAQAPLSRATPGEPDFKKGNAWFAEGKLEEAARAYQRAIEKEPQDPIYYYNLGIVYTRLQRYKEAITVFRQMLELQPQSYSAHKNLGELYGLLQDYRQALPYFQEAVELSPEDPEAFYNLGVCLLNTGAIRKAEQAFVKVTELQPDYPLAHYRLGMVYVNQNKKDEAILHLEKFLELAPDDPNADLARQIISFLRKKG